MLALTSAAARRGIGPAGGAMRTAVAPITHAARPRARSPAAAVLGTASRSRAALRTASTGAPMVSNPAGAATTAGAAMRLARLAMRSITATPRRTRSRASSTIAMASPQPGLFARPTYASVIAVYNEEAPDGVTRYDQATADKVVTAIAAVSSELHGADDGLDVVVGVGLPVWKQHCNGKGDPLPQGFADGDEEALRLDVLRNLPLQRDDGVAIVYIKYKDVLEPNSNPTTRAKALKSLNEFVTKAKDILSTHGLIGEDSGLRHTVQDGFVRPNEKIMGARFLDGSTNPSDAGAYDRNVLVAGPDHHAGGTFAITQKMFYQWEDIKSMSESAITRAVGRSQQDHEVRRLARAGMHSVAVHIPGASALLPP